MANADPNNTHHRTTTIRRLFGLALPIIVFAAGCGSSNVAEPIPGDAPEPTQDRIVVLNEGGDGEGHTPRGFAGSGTGLFAGDELNPNFPADDGVQIWLTFELPDGVEATNAIIRSDALTVRGNPFETLGNLQAAPVRYDTFGPAVVGIEPVGPTATCNPPDGSAFSCDVSEAVQAELAEGASIVQFQLRFEQISDPDGEQDLAMFFLTDSNTNEPGIFSLELS